MEIGREIRCIILIRSTLMKYSLMLQDVLVLAVFSTRVALLVDKTSSKTLTKRIGGASRYTAVGYRRLTSIRIDLIKHEIIHKNNSTTCQVLELCMQMNAYSLILFSHGSEVVIDPELIVIHFEQEHQSAQLIWWRP